MSASATFTSAFTSARSEIVISVVPGMFWMPITTISPSRTGRRVTTPSIGEAISVFPRQVARARELRARLGDPPLGGLRLRARRRRPRPAARRSRTAAAAPARAAPRRAPAARAASCARGLRGGAASASSGADELRPRGVGVAGGRHASRSARRPARRARGRPPPPAGDQLAHHRRADVGVAHGHDLARGGHGRAEDGRGASTRSSLHLDRRARRQHRRGRQRRAGDDDQTSGSLRANARMAIEL